MVMRPILIVDDEPIVRDTIGHWLESAGCKIAKAENSEEALKITDKQDFAVIVVDLRLPDKAGLTVLREVKAAKPHIRSIVIEAFPSVGLAVDAMKLSTIDYLVKPTAPDDLEALIQEALLKCQSCG